MVAPKDLPPLAYFGSVDTPLPAVGVDPDEDPDDELLPGGTPEWITRMLGFDPRMVPELAGPPPDPDYDVPGDAGDDE